MGVVGGEVFDPKPSAFRRAASPGEGLRGGRKEALVEDGVCPAFGGFNVSADVAGGDGFEDGVREEFSLQGSGVRNSSQLAGSGAQRNQEAEDRGSGGIWRTGRRGRFWGGRSLDQARGQVEAGVYATSNPPDQHADNNYARPTRRDRATTGAAGFRPWAKSIPNLRNMSPRKG